MAFFVAGGEVPQPVCRFLGPVCFSVLHHNINLNL